MTPALVQRVEVDEEHYDVAWTVGILRALGVTMVTFLAAPIVAQLFGEPRATDIVRVLAIRPLIDAAASIKVAHLMRNLQFRSLASIELPKALANTLVAITLAPWLGVWALVAGTLAGPAVYLIVSYLVAPYRPRLSFDSSAAQSLIHFGRWVFLTSLVVMAGQSTLRFVIGRELGAAELGLYYLAASLAFLPADIASQVVGKVAFPFYSRLQTDVRQASLAFRSILTSLFTLLLPAFALLIALAPSLVETILGTRWEGAAPIIRVLALANIIGLLGDTITPILQGTGRPDKILVIEGIQSSLLIVLAWGLANRYGVVGAAMAWLPAITASQLLSIVFVRQILPRPFAGLGLALSTIAAVSIIAAMTAIGIDNILPGLFGLITASSLGIALAGGLMWVLERRFALGLLAGLVRAFPQVAAFVGLSHG
jgi:PST family polysaccharide transporter/lipopolysaccharide exporter